jgi:hypothetical protein
MNPVETSGELAAVSRWSPGLKKSALVDHRYLRWRELCS